MGATSVTGVSGPGDAKSNGPKNNRNQYVSLLDPRIVLSGNGVTSTGGGDPDPQSYRTIYMPSHLILPASRLTVLVSGKPALNEKNVNDDGNLVSFVVYDLGYGGGYTFDYVIIDSVDNRFSPDVTGQ